METERRCRARRGFKRPAAFSGARHARWTAYWHNGGVIVRPTAALSNRCGSFAANWAHHRPRTLVHASRRVGYVSEFLRRPPAADRRAPGPRGEATASEVPGRERLTTTAVWTITRERAWATGRDCHRGRVVLGTPPPPPPWPKRLDLYLVLLLGPLHVMDSTMCQRSIETAVRRCMMQHRLCMAFD